MVSTISSPFQWIIGGYYINSHESYEPFMTQLPTVLINYTSLTQARAGSLFG